MKRWLPLLILIPLIAGAGLYFLRGQKKEALDLKIFFTCDTRGRLVPCGCFTGQNGGLTRLKTTLEKLAEPMAIRLDVGDAIRGTADFNLIEYKYILEAYAGMQFDALNIGHREAQLSKGQLDTIKQSAPVKLISANLFDKKSGERVFEPFHIIQRGRHKIAIVGVVDPRGLNETLGEGLMVEKMETVLGTLVPELKKKADFIVLLAFTDETTLAQLAREFYELNIILGGKVSQPAQDLRKENRSFISYTANESRTLGVLQVQVSTENKLTATSQEMILLHDRIHEHGSVKTLAANYRDEIRKTPLQVDDPAFLQENVVPGIKTAATYVGSQSCAECHSSAMATWKKSGHAHAFETLIETKADADPNCIGCHTVGFGTPSGYRREFASSKLVDVGCESCHGPGSLHVNQRLAGELVTFKFRPLGAGDCQKCHHGEFSRPFDWDEFWPLIQHGKEKSTAQK
ncbi:MAG: hypothetical protein H0X66_05410 [Verrucomicrobia bacterium]|nr:hypothetical protein [Verrucomicrobiota bacterium]